MRCCLVGDSKERSGKCSGLCFRGPETGPNCTTSEAKEGSTHLSQICCGDGVREQLFFVSNNNNTLLKCVGACQA